VRRTADLRRQQIIEEATRLFSNRGFDNVTTKELAASCEVSEPALYRYFASKDAIYDVVLSSLETRLDVVELFERLKDEQDIEKLLYDLATHIFQFFRTNQDVYRLMLYSTLG
jgi:AcrR family transcriptional regulator